MPLDSYLSDQFSGLSLERPLFYNWSIGLRFEIGPANLSCWRDDDRQILNEAYFTQALERAKKIYTQVVDEEDDLILVYQQYQDKCNKIDPEKNILEYISHAGLKKIIASAVTDIYLQDEEAEKLGEKGWKRLYIRLKASELDDIKFLKTCINVDFPDRTPYQYGEYYLVNLSKNIILCLYDDRGMDIIASDKKSLKKLFITCNQWILAYDRKQMDAMFNP